MAKKVKKINKKRMKFADEYLVDLNATQAAIRAGYSKKTAKSQGQRLLTFVDVQEYLVKRYEKLVITGEIATPEEVLGGYTKDTRFDPRLMFDEDKNPLPIPDLPDEIALSLVGFKIIDTVLRSDKDAQETVIKRVYEYKLPDKKSNRDSLGKFHNLFVEQHEHRLNIDTILAFKEFFPEQVWVKILQKLEMKVATNS